MLEHEGRPPVTIDEMNEAVILKAVEEQGRLNATAGSRRMHPDGSNPGPQQP